MSLAVRDIATLIGRIRTTTMNEASILFPCYLSRSMGEYIAQELGLNLLYAELYANMEELIRTRKDEIDVAIEWQIGKDVYPLQGLFKEYDVEAPLFLALNWNGLEPDNFEELGYAGTLNVPFDIEEMEQKFNDMLSE